MNATLRRALRASGALRVRPLRDAALLVTPGICGIDGPMPLISRPTFAQLACLASHAPGGAALLQPPSELGYIARLRAQGLAVYRAALQSPGWPGWQVVMDGSEDGTIVDQSRSGRAWRLAFDFRPGMALGEGEFVMPYTMNPTILARRGETAIRPSPDAERRIRVLFAGTWNDHTYRRRELIADTFGKLTRHEVVSAFLEFPHAIDRASGGAWHRSREGHAPIVFADTAHARVPQFEWLDAIHAADFLLCPPGCVFPLCYNLVEAMAGGTVPITNYPDWLTPPLRHGVECLSFTTASELHACLEQALAMPPRDVRAMRHAARRYYEQHLDLAGFRSRLLARGERRLTIHVVDETKPRARTMAPRGAVPEGAP
jgi:hypothetical protein